MWRRNPKRGTCGVKLRFGGFLPPYTNHIRPFFGEIVDRLLIRIKFVDCACHINVKWIGLTSINEISSNPTKSWSEAPWNSTKMTRKVTATKMWPMFDWCQQTLADKFYDVLWVVTAFISDWWTIYGENFIDGPPFQVRPSHGIPAPWLAIGEGLLVFLSTRRTAWYMWGYATLNTWNQSDELRVQFSSWTWLCIPGHPRNCRPYFIHMLQVWEWHTIWSYTLIV